MGEATFTDGVLTVPFELDPGVPGWPKITGAVRPATAAELRKYDGKDVALRKAAAGIDAAKDPVGFDNAISALTEYQAEFFAKHIASWSIGQVTKESISKLPPQYFGQLDAICFQGAAILGNSEGTSAS